jgi:DNA-binding NtrC family response regulator
VGRILFVDDEEAIRRLFVTFLAAEGYEVDSAFDVAGATDLLGKRPYDLVIVDKNLPDGSGLDVLRTCRERRPDVELLILTGYPSMESAVEALRCGAYDYLIKPVLDLDLVLEKVRRAIERRRLREENSLLVMAVEEAYRRAGGDASAPLPAKLEQALTAGTRRTPETVAALDELLERIEMAKKSLGGGDAKAAHDGLGRASEAALRLRSLIHGNGGA